MAPAILVVLYAMAAVDAAAADQTDTPTAVVRLDNIAAVPVAASTSGPPFIVVLTPRRSAHGPIAAKCREPARRCDRSRTWAPDAAIAAPFRSRNHAFQGDAQTSPLETFTDPEANQIASRLTDGH